jgi:hypothetical protein
MYECVYEREREQRESLCVCKYVRACGCMNTRVFSWPLKTCTDYIYRICYMWCTNSSCMYKRHGKVYDAVFSAAYTCTKPWHAHMQQSADRYACPLGYLRHGRSRSKHTCALFFRGHRRFFWQRIFSLVQKNKHTRAMNGQICDMWPCFRVMCRYRSIICIDPGRSSPQLAILCATGHVLASAIHKR